ncbi:Ff.00g036070.m01.CDS01 [Fusarium sp. VM40]|nr:Ff.00g036070.m01.CDS01 [Fusarium sp. VM40]
MRFSSLTGLSAVGLAALATCDTTYDYIVVGGGPSGLITAERLTEANKKVLLLERGPGPTVATGSNHTLPWDSSLTPIDVPGLSSAVGGLDLWNEYMCDDTAGLAACVLGGGVTVNFMVFVHPPARDFDDKWPKGWKWNDVAPAANRLYARNPGTLEPSQNKQRYDTGLYNTLSGFFNTIGWKSVDMIKQPNEKHQVYSWPSWNVKDAQRAGPVKTYLPLAQKQKNFTLRLGTKVIRVVRSGSKATGVEVETADGKKQIIKLAKNGRVVLSAGALTTPRLLFNSGIGPKKQIQTAKQTGVTLPAERHWIELPVGENLMDHPIFSFNVKTGGAYGMLDTDSVLNGTDSKNIKLYEDKSAGILTQGRHRVIFFTSQKGPDGVTRYFQGSCAASGDGVVSIKVYMTHGLTSSGVLGLTKDGKTVFDRSPYLQTKGDTETAKIFVEDFVKSITKASTGFELQPATNTSAILASPANGNHFAGTAKMGADDGRKGGSSVVDTNTKVYGMDNLFITDASIHPDLPTGNIQTIVMVAAEAAVAKILAC